MSCRPFAYIMWESESLSTFMVSESLPRVFNQSRTSFQHLPIRFSLWVEWWCMWTPVNLRWQINGVKGIIRLWMLARSGVKGAQHPLAAVGLPDHPHWPQQCTKGQPESCVTCPLTLREGWRGGWGEIRMHTKGSNWGDADQSSP